MNKSGPLGAVFTVCPEVCAESQTTRVDARSRWNRLAWARDQFSAIYKIVIRCEAVAWPSLACILFVLAVHFITSGLPDNQKHL